MAEVAGDRREVGGVGFETAARAAETLRSARVDRDVSELARGVVVPAHHFAVYDDARSDTAADGEVHEIAGCFISALAEPHVGDRAGDWRVLDVDGESGGVGERVADVDVAPAELRGVE